MSKIKITKTKDYTVMSNSHLRDKTMSLKAKGLLSVMLALPDDWDYSIAGLVAICKEGRDTIMTTLKELKEFGYLVVEKVMPDKTESGRIEYIYNIYEQPCGIQGTRKQDTEKQPLVFPTQLNTNQLSTKELNTKIKESTKESLSIFSKDVADSIEKWLQYKKEKRQSYKPTGLKALLNKLEKEVRENGDQYVINAIDHSIECNYSGIYPEKTYQQKKDPFCVDREYTAEEIERDFHFSTIDELDDIEL